MSTPLDPARAAFYGVFVAAAYTMYNNEPGNLTPLPQGLPGGWNLSAWITMADFLESTTASKFYGIVAQEAANPANVVVALRGTEGITEWIDDATSIRKVPFSLVPHAGNVAYGFERIYATIQIHSAASHSAVPLSDGAAVSREIGTSPQLTGTFADQLHQLVSRTPVRQGAMAERAVSQPSVVVTGHSLGSALATLLVVENTVKHYFQIGLLSTLASPKVGDADFATFFNGLPITSWRIVNTPDIVPKLPFAWFGFSDVSQTYTFNSHPYAKASLSCDHHLSTYLHWLDATVHVDPGCTR